MTDFVTTNYCVNVSDRRAITIAPEGPASAPAKTIVDLFNARIETEAGKTRAAMKTYSEDGWTSITWSEYKDSVYGVAKALIAEGIERHAGVAIIGFNDPHWFAGQMGTCLAGGVTAGIYTTNNAEACMYVINNANAQFVFVENDTQAQKVVSLRAQMPQVKQVVQWTDEPTAEGVISWDAFIAKGADVKEEEVAAIADTITPEECATLIYTSGTTGPPKGVMVSHDNITWTGSAIGEYVGFKEAQETLLSYLPLSHIAAQMIDFCIHLIYGTTVHFAKADAMKGMLKTYLQETRPTVFLGVPRVWEKIEEAVRAIGAETTGLKKKISNWAKAKGLEGGLAEQKGNSKPWGTFFANKIVFDKVKAQLGLDRAHYLATAAAPITEITLKYFLALGMPLYEIYGASETSGPITVSRPNQYRTGKAGPAFPGCEMKIADMDDEGNGEILAKGRHIFMGYLGMKEKSAETIDEDGFYRSGDIGQVDGEGFLSITGRKKEILITAGGENVAPVLLEDQIKAQLPFLSNVMCIGDMRKYLTCLVALKTELDLDNGGEPLEELTKACITDLEAAGVTGVTTVPEAMASEKLAEVIDAGLKAANEKAISRAQSVQKATILPRDFSVPGGELTPTFKLKRTPVGKMYEAQIEAMYA